MGPSPAVLEFNIRYDSGNITGIVVLTDSPASEERVNDLVYNEDNQYPRGPASDVTSGS